MFYLLFLLWVLPFLLSFCNFLPPILVNLHQLVNGATLSPNALVLLILGSSFSPLTPSSSPPNGNASSPCPTTTIGFFVFSTLHFSPFCTKSSSLVVLTNALDRVQMVPVEAMPALTVRPSLAHCTVAQRAQSS
ncbi:hypothetical protein BGZ57DRAFT_884228 [Hyaloscypha finlandica]|nr:hypothetical protein BGZ57DRAFT_884228 [Hyaloscypha finlandica]